MTKLQTKRLELLNETAGHFHLGNRSQKLDGGACLYAGVGCAIGRKIEDKALCARLDLLEDSSVKNDRLFKSLPTDLQELGQEFIASIQSLHDSVLNWDGKGLSAVGIKAVSDIKKEFNLN